MSDIYDRAAATMQRALQPRPIGKGAALTLTKTSSGVRDPVTGITSPVVTTFNALGFRGSFAMRDIDGTLIRSGDVKFLIAPLQTNGATLPVPASTDSLSFDGAVYKMIACSPMNYAGLLVGYKVQARL